MAAAAPAEGLGAQPTIADADKLADAVSSLEVKPDQAEVAAHRSHDPQYNQKRTDPFQFGSRFLKEEDDVFEFNAWDHVETDDIYKEYAEQQYEMQDRKSTRLNSSHSGESRMPSSA